MPPIRLLPLTLAAVLAAAPVAAQEAFSWVYDAHFPLDPGSAELNLVATQDGLVAVSQDRYLPDGLIWAQCVSGFAGGNVILRFEAFAGAAQAGDAVAFQMSDGSGTVLTNTATIVAAGLGDPVGGPEMLVDAQGPELAMLAAAPVFTYGVVGLTDFIIGFDLTGNQDYVARFIEDCADSTAAGSGGAMTAPETLVAEFGPAITGHVWTRFTEVTDDPFETILDVVYGVPETDDVLILGTCFIGAQGPLVSMDIAADVEGLRDQDAADLRFTTPDGRSAVVPGAVLGVNAEVGVSGVEVVLEMSDPAWLTIAGDETLRIERVGGRGGITITGNGPNTLGTFLADCAEIDSLTPESGQRPSAPIGAQPGFLACDAQGRVASRDTGAPQVLNFVNATSGFRGLIWFDPNGVPVEVAGLSPGQASAFTTDPGHVWMATDGPGNCREMIQPAAGQSEYRLTVEN